MPFLSNDRASGLGTGTSAKESTGVVLVLAGESVHGRRQRGQGTVLPWIFIHGTDKVEGSLIVLFFGLTFFVGSPLKIFLPTPLSLAVHYRGIQHDQGDPIEA